jgi:hypothetical protein
LGTGLTSEVVKLRNNRNKNAPYEFELINPTDFKIKISYEVSGIIFNQLFQDAITKLRKGGVAEGAEEANTNDLPSNFKVDKRYLFLVENGTKSNIKKIWQDVGKDGIKISSCKVVDAEFERKDDKFHINCFFEGVYHDERE